MNLGQPLGSTQGSLSQGLEVRLHPDVSVEDMRVGKFLVVEGAIAFLCMLTDVSLGTPSARIVANPPSPMTIFKRSSGWERHLYHQLTPMLMFTPESDEPFFGAAGKSHQQPVGSGLASFQHKAAVPWNYCQLKPFPATSVKSTTLVNGTSGRCLAGKMILTDATSPSVNR